MFCCEGHLASGCAVVSKYLLEITIVGPCKHFWEANLSCYNTVKNKNSHNETNEKASGESDHTPGTSPTGGQSCPPSSFMLGPRLLHIANIVFKNVPPCAFWPLLLQNPGDGPAMLLLHI